MDTLEFLGKGFAYLIIIGLLVKPIAFVLMFLYAIGKTLVADFPKFAKNSMMPIIRREKFFFVSLFTTILSTPILILALGGNKEIAFLPLAVFLMLILPIYAIKYLICGTIKLFRDRHPAPKV